MRCRALLLLLFLTGGVDDAVAQEETGCYANFTEMGIIEDTANVQQRRTYVLCPNTTFNIGSIGPDGSFIGDETPLGLRANMRVLCGENGSIENNCLLNGGILGVAAFPSLFAFEFLHNVFVSGLTFAGQSLHGSLLRLPGEITFFDCVFKNMGNLAPASASWYPAQFFQPPPAMSEKSNPSLNSWKRTPSNNLQEVVPYREPTPEDVLHVSYINCVFSDNFSIELPEEQGVPGVIATQGQTITTLRNCIFQFNLYPAVGRFPLGFTVLQDEGEIQVENSCFMNNVADGPAPIVVLKGVATAAANSNEINPTPGNPCEFIAVYDNLDLAAPPSECIQAEGDGICVNIVLGDATQPTAAPTLSPAPTALPTSSPAPTLSFPPSTQPSTAPSTFPVEAQTTMPTFQSVPVTPAPESPSEPAPEGPTTSATVVVTGSFIQVSLTLAATLLVL